MFLSVLAATSACYQLPLVAPLLILVLRDAVCCHSHKYPANSCAELSEQEPDIPSGNCWILNSTLSPVQVFCEMGKVFQASLCHPRLVVGIVSFIIANIHQHL